MTLVSASRMNTVQDGLAQQLLRQPCRRNTVTSLATGEQKDAVVGTRIAIDRDGVEARLKGGASRRLHCICDKGASHVSTASIVAMLG